MRHLMGLFSWLWVVAVMAADTQVAEFSAQMPGVFDSAEHPQAAIVSKAFYVHGARAQALRGKQVRLDMVVRRVTGLAELSATFRCSTQPGNELRVARTFPVNVGLKGEWEPFVAHFDIPDLDQIAHFNVQFGFRQNGPVRNVWEIDQLRYVLPETPQVLTLEPGAALGLSSSEPPLLLVENGELKFKIVLAAEADAIAREAAREVAEHFRLATGKQPEIVAEGAWSGPAVQIGDTAAARRYGVEPARLPPESVVVARAGNNLILSGGDAPGLPAGQVISRAGVAVGTLYAAYEFLERELGVRWYWPGRLGTVVPPLRDLAMGRCLVTARPVYDTRKFFYALPRDPDLTSAEVDRWYRRNRTGGSAGDPVGMHSFNAWPKKFGQEHPEYFALQADGRRKTDEVQGGHVCMSSAEVLRETIAEKVATLTQPGALSKVSPVMPGDSNGLYYCRCPECQAKVTPERGRAGTYSDAVWGFVNRVAAGVSEQAPGTYISCCAYGDYLRKPSFPLLPNVAVTLCFGNPPRGCATYRSSWAALLEEWESTGAALYVWEYWNNTRYGRGVYGAPAVYPRQLQELFLLGEGRVRGRAIELCDIDADGKSIHAWADWVYDVLNVYVGMRLMWDPRADVDRILEEYYTGFFGPAADTLRAFHEEMEEAYLRAGWETHDTWDFQRCWGELYPPPFVDRMMALLRRAVSESGGQAPYAARTQKLLDGYLPFERNSLMFRGPKAEINQPELKVPREGRASIGNFCDSYNVYAQRATTTMHFRHDGEFLHIQAECSYPAERQLVNFAEAQGDRDALLWNYESVEFFFAGKDGVVRQFILGAPGKLADFAYPAADVGTAMRWNSERVKWSARRDGDHLWSAEIAIPLSELEPREDGSFAVNFYRNHYYRPAATAPFVWEQSGWLPVYGEFHKVERFGKMILLP